MTDADAYFSLENFEHRALFQGGEPVWMALLQINEYLKNFTPQIEIEVSEGVYLKRRELISIGRGTLIEPGVMIQGPCIIGKNCEIRHGAYLREGTILGDKCHVGHSSELKHSILLNEAAVTHFVYVGDCLIGNFVNLGAGVKCANLRLDRKAVKIVIDGKKWNTNLKKFGAVIGDGAQIGCNSVLNPGTLVGKESFSYPLMNLKGVIPSRSQIDARGVHPIEQKILQKLLWKSTAPK